MDPIVGCAAFGVVLSGCGGYLAANQWMEWRNHRRHRQTLMANRQGAVVGAMTWWFTRGVPLMLPWAHALLRRPIMRRYAFWARSFFSERSVEATMDGLVSTMLAAVFVVVCVGWLAGGSAVFGIALAGCTLVAAAGFLRNREDKRRDRLRDEIPDALRSLGVDFRAGLSLSQTLTQTASEMKGPLGELFKASALVLETGGTASEALAVFRERVDVPELAFVAVALDVQHRAGGSIAHVLDAARESVESEIELEQSLRVQTAQAKLSAGIVTAMPFILVGLFSLISPGFLDPFFTSLAGMLLLAVALIMQAAGVLLVRSMLKSEGRGDA